MHNAYFEIFKLKNIWSCEEEVSIYSLSSVENREREIERGGSICFLCYPAISNPHFPSS